MEDYLQKILRARVYDVAEETPLERAKNLSKKFKNDIWLKRYVSALIQRQWGANLIKFQGAQLPGGITMNGEFIYNEGKAKVEKLEEEMISKYETPPLDMIG